MLILPFKKLDPKAKLPTRGSELAAGYDLYSIEQYTLKPLERKLFKTGLAVAIPHGLYGRIAPRSGLAYKNGLDVMAGVIDEDYRGEVGVILINLGTEPITLPIIKDEKETPVAQIIFENYTEASFQEMPELPETFRGEGGFGSTDKVKESTVDGALKAMKIIVDNIDIKRKPEVSESELIKIRASVPPIVPLTEPPERKYNEDKPYHQEGRSSILERYREKVPEGKPVGYEKLVKERETTQ